MAKTPSRSDTVGPMDLEALVSRMHDLTLQAKILQQHSTALTTAFEELHSSLKQAVMSTGLTEAFAAADAQEPAPAPPRTRGKAKPPEPAPAPEPAAPPTEPVKLKDVQRAAQKAYAAGKDKVIMTILKSYGIKSLSMAHPDHYPDIVKRIEDAL